MLLSRLPCSWDDHVTQFTQKLAEQFWEGFCFSELVFPFALLSFPFLPAWTWMRGLEAQQLSCYYEYKYEREAYKLVQEMERS